MLGLRTATGSCGIPNRAVLGHDAFLAPQGESCWPSGSMDSPHEDPDAGAPVSRGIQYSATQSRFEPCSEIALSRCVHRRNLEPLVKAPRQPSICNSLLSHIEIMGRIEIMRSKRDHEIEVSPSVIASDSCLLEIRPMWPHERIGKPYKLIG